MDEYELRPHPLRNVWRWTGVALIAMGVFSVATHYRPENAAPMILIGAAAIAASVFVKWKRKIDS